MSLRVRKKNMPKNRVPLSEADLELQCSRWNEKNPVGAHVFVLRDNGVKFLTKTRSTAYVMGGHSAVIFVEGIAGCYLLSRLTMVKPEKI
jgi:hypothetical protein